MSSWIKNKRKLLSISQEEMAESLNISRPTYIKLEKGKSKPTEQQKIILARIEIREVPKEDVRKFKEVLLYILGKVGSRPNIGQTVLYKLLYFIDFDFYEKFEKQLIGATYIKNTYGPTPVSFAKIVKQMKLKGELVEVKSKYFDHNQTKYIPVKEVDILNLSGRELKHIDSEIERLARFTAKQLSELSHKDTPWLIAKDREILDYEFVFYRPEETSVREYEPL